MAKDINLTGTWVGEYRQHDRPHPITAELRQSGEGLTGTMRDGEPDKDMPISEVTSGSEDEQIVAKLLAIFPDAPMPAPNVVPRNVRRSRLMVVPRGSIESANGGSNNLSG